MGFVRHDHIMLVGLSLTTVGIFVGMRSLLQRFRDASEIQPIKPKTQYITQETEDSLPMSTLNSLLDHYNYSIRETAAKIICDRAINDDRTLQRLLWGIAQPGYDERMRSLRALAMLTDQNTLHLLNTPQAYAAFVRSLEMSALEAPSDVLDDVYFDEYYLRNIAEKLCLMFLMQLTVKFGMDELVRAHFVDRWLAKQNWGSTDKQRRENFARYLHYRDNRISDICRRLRQSTIGRAALERARLITPQLPPTRRRTASFVYNEPETPTAARPHADAEHPAGPPEETGAGTSAGAGAGTDRSGRSRLLEALPEAQPGDRLLTGEQLRRLGDLVFATAAAEDPGTISTRRAGDAVLVEIDVDRLAPQGGTTTSTDASGLTRDGIEALRGAYLLRRVNVDSDSDSRSRSASQTRPPNQNTREERRIRRQHREAMVLNDGTRPLGRGDIIERESE